MSGDWHQFEQHGAYSLQKLHKIMLIEFNRFDTRQ
jgi:hypothetical protein